ncbi:MAG TPA: hypothetical protein VFF53_06335 [Geobacteraceae bacterium]|nr:hypothetical protein [Geobacteraceae bacterium]
MRSSASFSDFLAKVCLAGLLCLTAGSLAHAGWDAAVSTPSRSRVAVLPIINLSGTAAPLKEIRTTLLAEAGKRGIKVLGEDELEQFMARHRLRHTGGLDEATAQAFHNEAGVENILVTSLQLYDPTYPPKISLDARLLSSGAVPKIIWTDAVSMAGDDAPGLFGTGLIENPALLTAAAVRRLADSLASGMTDGGKPVNQERVAVRFRPRLSFHSSDLATGKTTRIAVVPFSNRSQRSYAGELLALQFVRELARGGAVTVIEPGVVRQKFLAFRIIMDEGLSLANAGVLFEVLDADLIVSGDVMEYDDYEGSMGTPRVAFSAWMFDRRNRRVVWASESHNSGDDGLHLFDIGKQRTAQILARNMVRGVVEQMLLPAATGAAASTPAPSDREGDGVIHNEQN